MAAMHEIEAIYNKKKSGAYGIADYADGAIEILRIINTNPESQTMQKGFVCVTDLIKRLVSVDFAFRLLHPIGLFLVSEAHDEVTTRFFPHYLAVYERAGGNGVSTYDADYSLNLQIYSATLAQRQCNIKVDISGLVNKAVESSVGFAMSSGHRPPLLDSFIDARARIKSQIDTGTLKPLLPLDEASWNELLQRR